jgi:type III restriction enzyme
LALTEAQDTRSVGQTEVRLRFLSELALLTLRESTSVEVSKSIYERQVWPSRNGGLEKAFIHWAQADSQVLAFCKIIESRHTFE